MCVRDITSLVFLVLSRLSAYADYPLYVLLFISKANNLRGFLQRTHLSELLPLDDMHHLHTFAGMVVGVEVVWHSCFHIARWALNGEARFLAEHVTGVTGLIALLVTPFIVWPMLFRKLRETIPYERRKWLHYLSVVWGVAICFHAPKRSIGLVMGSAVGVYGLDWLYGYFFAVHHVTTLECQRIGNAVEVVWENPDGFLKDGGCAGGFIYICIPWVSKTQWHAFSLVKHPTRRNHSAICVAAVGDWTSALHAELAKPCARPGWIYGPFPSPFSTATGFDNLIAIASGIGITPSISTIVNLAATRKVHVIWMCRDPDLVEFYLANTEFDDDGWSFIFYTGKRRLVLGERPPNPRVKVILGRPNLEELILGLVDSVVLGAPMPPALMERASAAEAAIYNKPPIARFCDALERAATSYSVEEMFRLAVSRSTPELDGKPAQSASLAGFVQMVRTVCDITGGLSDDELKRYFELVDTSGDGRVDLSELEEILGVLRKAGEAEEKEREAKSVREETPPKGALTRMKTFRDVRDAAQRRQMISGWQMMYCGGAAPVEQQLRKIHRKYDMPLKVESFAW